MLFLKDSFRFVYHYLPSGDASQEFIIYKEFIKTGYHVRNKNV